MLMRLVALVHSREIRPRREALLGHAAAAVQETCGIDDQLLLAQPAVGAVDDGFARGPELAARRSHASPWVAWSA